MSSSTSRRLVAAALAVACAFTPGRSFAQACCAGASAITPGRLELHERALFGWSTRAGAALGSYDSRGRARSLAKGGAEIDFEHSVFAAVRWLRRGQAGALMPLVHSYRRSATTGAEHGGGFGDVNLFARYDLTWAREHRYVPGIALLAGLTLPTGRPPESAYLPLASDATGLGALQLNAGVALERAWGPFLVNLLGLASKRFDREVHGVSSSLGTQLSSTLAVGALLGRHAAIAAVTTFTYEGDAALDHHPVEGSARRRLRVALAASVAFSDTFRAQTNIFSDPPISGFGANQLASTGMTLTLVRSFL